MDQGNLLTPPQNSPVSTTNPGWRSCFRVLLGFGLLYVVISIIRLVMGVGPNLLMRWYGAGPDFRIYIGATLNYSVGIAAYLLLPAYALRRVLGVDPRPALFPFFKGWWKDLLFGFLLVTITLTLFFIFEFQVGGLVLVGWTWQSMQAVTWFRLAWVGLLINVGVAIGEETVFRGFLLTGLRTVWRKWAALAAMTIIFGLFHLPAYMEDGLSFATLTLAILLASLFGLLFGLAYLRTGSLWLPVGLHFTWNFVENDLLNLTADTTNPNLIGAVTRLKEPLTLTGISLGNVVVLETLAFAFISLGVWMWLRHRPVTEIALST